MQLKGPDLNSHLARGLAPVYLVSGDEPLLVEEACDAILTAARTAGYDERERLFVDQHFDWHTLLEATASLSLFASRRVFDVRLAAPKVDKAASEVLRSYATAPPEDTLLLLRAPKLEGKQRSTAWFKALDFAGVILQLWPIKAQELPRWLRERARARQIEFTPDALTQLAASVEGNLLAAVQELDKLALLELPQPIEVDALLAASGDSATYEVFDLMDAALLGEGARVSRMLTGLRAEGVALFAILGALRFQLKQVDGVQRIFGPPAKQRAVAAFRRRASATPGLPTELAAELALIDTQAKGGFLGDPWISLERVLLRIAGFEVGSLETDLELLR